MEGKKLEIGEKLISLLGEFKEVFSTAKFADLKLEDGSIVRIDTDQPQTGSAIQAIGTDGKAVAMPDGEYTIVTDAGKIKITCVAGFITELETLDQANTENETPAGAPPAEDIQMSKEDMNKLVETVAQLGTRLAAIEEKVGSAAMTTDVNNQIEKQGTDLKQAIADVLAKFEGHEKFSKELFALVEKISEAENPTNKPADTTKKVLTPSESVALFRKTQKL